MDTPVWKEYVTHFLMSCFLQYSFHKLPAVDPTSHFWELYSTCSANAQQKCGEKCTDANAHQHAHTSTHTHSYVLETWRTSNCSAAHPRFICHWANYSLCCEYQSAHETDATQSLTQGTRNEFLWVQSVSVSHNLSFFFRQFFVSKQVISLSFCF